MGRRARAAAWIAIVGLAGCQPALIKMQAPPRTACGAFFFAPLPEKPYLPEVFPARKDCPYALCLDQENYARLLKRIELLEADDARVRALYSDQALAYARAAGLPADSASGLK